MEHPGAAPSPIQGKPLLYGTVHGAIGEYSGDVIMAMFAFRPFSNIQIMGSLVGINWSYVHLYTRGSYLS